MNRFYRKLVFFYLVYHPGHSNARMINKIKYHRHYNHILPFKTVCVSLGFNISLPKSFNISSSWTFHFTTMTTAETANIFRQVSGFIPQMKNSSPITSSARFLTVASQAAPLQRLISTSASLGNFPVSENKPT